MISWKYVPSLCLLFALPLVPTFIHSYAGARVVDRRSLVTTLGSFPGYKAAATDRSRTWGRQNFDTDDWVEQRYASPADEVVVTVVRSYDSKTLYHHPELACAYATPFDHYETRRFPQRLEIPVHVLQASTGRRAAAFYALHYDDRFIEHPIRFQLRTAGEQLFSARRPMTLIFVHDPATGKATELNTINAVSLLFKTIDRFLASAPTDGTR